MFNSFISCSFSKDVWMFIDEGKMDIWKKQSKEENKSNQLKKVSRAVLC
jgi:hypothetical protein